MAEKRRRMDEKVLIQRENQLKIKFNIKHGKEHFLTLTSKKFLCGGVYFQLQAHSTRCTEKHEPGNIVISVRYLKMLKNDNLIYRCNLASIAMDIQNVIFTEDETWHFISHYESPALNTSALFLYSFDVFVQLDLATNTSPFASLYEDTDLSDFELRVQDGSISVHSAILAGFSPYFKTLFAGDWKETSDGYCNVTGTTKETLEHFKDYIYLNKLPERGIQQLLLLGSYYMIPDLVQKCSAKLLYKLNSENLMDLIEFAVKYKVNNLLLAIINIVQTGVINTEDIAVEDWMTVCQATGTILKK